MNIKEQSILYLEAKIHVKQIEVENLIADINELKNIQESLMDNSKLIIELKEYKELIKKYKSYDTEKI